MIEPQENQHPFYRFEIKRYKFRTCFLNFGFLDEGLDLTLALSFDIQ